MAAAAAPQILLQGSSPAGAAYRVLVRPTLDFASPSLFHLTYVKHWATRPPARLCRDPDLALDVYLEPVPFAVLVELVECAKNPAVDAEYRDALPPSLAAVCTLVVWQGYRAYYALSAPTTTTSEAEERPAKRARLELPDGFPTPVEMRARLMDRPFKLIRTAMDEADDAGEHVALVEAENSHGWPQEIVQLLREVGYRTQLRVQGAQHWRQHRLLRYPGLEISW